MRAWVVLATVVACGRLAFDERSDAPATVGDGSATDGLGSDASPVGFCAGLAPAPTFCDDFDEARPLGSGWKDFVSQLGGSGTISSTMAKSPPAAFESIVATQTGSGVGYACLEYSLPVTHNFRYQYDLFLVARPSSGNVELGSVNFSVAGSGSFYNDIYLRSPGMDSYREEQGSATFNYTDTNFPTQLSAGAWHHIDMRLDLDAKTYSLTIDGSTYGSGATSYPVAAAPITVQCGINYMNQPQMGWDFYVDNVVIDAQ